MQEGWFSVGVCLMHRGMAASMVLVQGMPKERNIGHMHNKQSINKIAFSGTSGF
jgi:hypothetical protein